MPEEITTKQQRSPYDIDFSAPKSPTIPSTRPKSSYDIDFSAPKTAKEEPTTGIGATRWYQKNVLDKLDQYIPDEVKKSTVGNYTARLAAHLAKFGPEALDFATTPAGASLIAGNIFSAFFPPARPVMGAINVGLGAWMTPSAITAVEEAAKNWKDPAKVANAIIQAGTAAGAITGGAGQVRSGVRSISAKRAAARGAAPETITPAGGPAAVAGGAAAARHAARVAAAPIAPGVPAGAVRVVPPGTPQVTWPPPAKPPVRAFLEWASGVSPKQQIKTLSENVWRSHMAKGWRELAQSEAAVTDEYHRLATKPKAYNDAIIDAIEAQEKNPAVRQPDPQNQLIADYMEAAMSNEWRKVMQLGIPGLDRVYYEHYFPHIAKNPAQAQGLIQQWYAARPMSGRESFRMHRNHPTFEDFRKAGLEMVSDNPVELFLLKLQEVKKFRIANEILNEYKDLGIAKFHPSSRITKVLKNGVIQERRYSQPMPEGYRGVNDKLFKVGPRGLAGEWVFPDPVATIIERQLSPGLAQILAKGPMGEVTPHVVNAIKQYNANTNVANVSFSAFHGFLESGLAMLNDASLAAQYALIGKPVKAGKALATSFGWAPFRDFYKGGKFIEEYYHPGAHPELQPLMDMFLEGGGRIRSERLLKDELAYRGNLFEYLFDQWEHASPGASKALPKTFRRAFGFIMQDLVPRMKVNGAMRMLEFELERMKHDRTPITPYTIRAAAAKVVDAVDDRHGQMITDNLFWPRALRDLSYMTFRFLQWSYGSLRAGAGGAVDWARALTVKPLLGEKFSPTQRMTWLAALPFTYGLTNLMYQYWMSGKGFTDPRDLIFPQNGKNNPDGSPQRDMVPWSGYFKDYYEWTHSPLTTLAHKLSNSINVLWDLGVKNADIFNREIIDPDAEPYPLKQAWQGLRYILEKGEPISLQNLLAIERRGEKVGPVDVTRASVGIRTAPAFTMRSEAQNMLLKFAGRKLEAGPIDPEEFDKRVESRRLLQGLQTGDLGTVDVDRSFDDGKITAKDRANIMRRSVTEPWSRVGNWGRLFGQIKTKDALKVWDVATPEEKRLIAPLLLQHLRKIPSVANRDEQKRLTDRIYAAANPYLYGQQPPEVRRGPYSIQ